MKYAKENDEERSGQQGLAERQNCTVVKMARSLVKAKELPNQYRAEAIATSVYLLNISPTKAILNQTPYEAWRGKKPSVGHLRIFGCITYAFVNSLNHHKLDEKSEKCMFIGFCPHSKALYNPLNGKVIITRNVPFNEEARWNWDSSSDGI